jgi:two-component system CheB/CheR fusion protein
MRQERHSPSRARFLSRLGLNAKQPESDVMKKVPQTFHKETRSKRRTLSTRAKGRAALAKELHDAQERERLLNNDLQSILRGIDSAALFLDDQFNIRFCTRAAESLFNISSAGAKRTLTDISLFTNDVHLLRDAKKMLRCLTPIERRVQTDDGAIYIRRIAPHGVDGDGAIGVVLTYCDISEQSRTAAALEAMKQQMQLANGAKSRLLAEASHNLRQPLQSLVLLNALLAKTVESQKAQALVARFGETLKSMEEMLDALLDMNKIEAEDLRPAVIRFSMNDLLDSLAKEFKPEAQAKNLSFRVIPCSLSTYSDPLLLEQMTRNLVSNALKYTKQGKVLLGCRRRQNSLRIEVWDTGIGIPDKEFEAVFNEFHRGSAAGRIDAAKHERDQGLGLGLSIVKRLGQLLDHKIGLRSRLGKGSIFTIEIPRAADEAKPAIVAKEPESRSLALTQPTSVSECRQAQLTPRSAQPSGSPIIYLVDDDPNVRDALRCVLEDDGRVVEDFETCQEFLQAYRPSQEACILIDAYLPGMKGVELLQRLKEMGNHSPAIMITGKADVSMAVQAMKAGALDFIEKPVGRTELLYCVDEALKQARDSTAFSAKRAAAADQLSELTPRQRQIMELVLAGHSSKNIAADLGISQRTVENHRASIMKKTGSKSLPELARLALTAALQNQMEAPRR